MQSKTSCFNATIFRKNMLHFWPVWVVYTLYTLFMVPANIYFNTITSLYKGLNLTAEEIKLQKTSGFIWTIGQALSPVTCAVIGLVCALAVFNFLYNSRSAHACHSFPVTRKELFITNYFSGLLFFTIPQLLSFLLGVFVCALKGITSLEYMLYWFLLMEGMCFFFYNMAILIGMFTGLLFAIPVLFVIANYLYVGCRYVITVIMGVMSYGLMDIYAQRSSSILSPLAFMNSKVSITHMYDELTGETFHLLGSKFVAAYAAAGIVLGIAAYVLYKKRKIEVTGDILSIKWMKPVVRWAFAAASALLFSILMNTVFPQEMLRGKEFLLVLLSVLIVGFLGFFLGEMILEKKTNIFKKKRFVECGIYSLLMLLFVIGLEYDVFHAETKQPKTADIASVSISLYYPLYETNEAGIQELLNIHKQIIDSKKEFESYVRKNGYDETCKYVSVNYILKDGTPFIRNYYVPADETYLADPDSVVAKLTDKSCDAELFIRGNLCINFDEVKLTNISLEVYDANLSYHTVNIDADLYDEFFEAMKADVNEGHMIPKNFLDVNNDDYQYWNYLSFELNGKNIKTVYDYHNVMNDTVYTTTMMQGMGFNKNCVHILEFLKKHDYVNDQDKLLFTGKEYTEKQQNVEK